MTQNNREISYTGVSSFETRIKVWEDSVSAASSRIELAKSFQTTGIDIITQLKKIKNEENVDREKMVKLYQQCLNYIEKGTKLEREARKDLFSLHHAQPKAHV